MRKEGPKLEKHNVAKDCRHRLCSDYRPVSGKLRAQLLPRLAGNLHHPVTMVPSPEDQGPDLMKPLPHELMAVWRIGSLKNDSPDGLDPVE
ncbi:hypothetical protein [Ensifer adhaerens]|uniref:hypothetical protein n=1 Tax=Ensifer adhaerens TaxID=106592 RepID=UPI001319D346|nr:hypothetical protein [Ensifer adhaerens]